jgi:ribonuclease J
VAVVLKFLGGLGDIGRNCMTIDDGGEILIIDAGLFFPELRAFGVDIALPDFTVLEPDADRVVGIVLSHGHEDHVGALGKLSEMVTAPIYGSRVTLAIAAKRLEESRAQNPTVLVEDYETVTIGKFTVTYLPVAHSVPDSNALVIETSEGIIYHTGDFKLDPTPLDSRTTDLKPLRDLGIAGKVSLLLIDATNGDEVGWTETELAVRPAFRDIFREHPDKRVIFSCFASHLHRVIQIAAEAVAAGRKVAPAGRSMLRIFQIAEELDMFNFPEGSIVELKEADRLPAGRVCVIATGGQGEPRAALSLMARNEHRQVHLTENDIIVMSADAIPGNETDVGLVIDQLARLGVEVVHPGMRKVHVSGHAKRDEIREVIRVARPKAVIPIHGEYRHMTSVSRLTLEEHPSSQPLVVEDGAIVEMTRSGISQIGTFPAPYIYRSNAVGPDVPDQLIQQRMRLQASGVLVLAVHVDDDESVVVHADQFGWLNASMFEEARPGILEELTKLVQAALENSMPDNDLESHLEARMRGYARKRTSLIPHVFVTVEPRGGGE